MRVWLSIYSGNRVVWFCAALCGGSAAASFQFFSLLQILPWWLGPLAVLEVLLSVSALPLLCVAKGLALLFAASVLLLDPLDKEELRGGALLCLDEAGFTVTVRGATIHYEWRYVRLREEFSTFVFELPRGVRQLLPWTCLSSERELEQVRALALQRSLAGEPWAPRWVQGR